MPEKEICSVVDSMLKHLNMTRDQLPLDLDDLKKLESFTSLVHLLYMIGARHYHGSETMGIPCIGFYLLLAIQRATLKFTEHKNSSWIVGTKSLCMIIEVDTYPL
jgi:hypothetical protein